MYIYEICWNILRLGSYHTKVKMAGSDCPCTYDPANNPRCQMYEAVVITADYPIPCGRSSEVEHPVANGKVGDNRKLSSAPTNKRE